jgi:hypothetical protein
LRKPGEVVRTEDRFRLNHPIGNRRTKAAARREYSHRTSQAEIQICQKTDAVPISMGDQDTPRVLAQVRLFVGLLLPVHDGHQALFVRRRVEMETHRQADGDFVAIFPLKRQGQVTLGG